MNYLLDTCAVSELAKPAPDQRVTAWMSNTPPNRLFLSSVTIGEIRKGLTKLSESRRKNELTHWLNTLLEDYRERIHPIDTPVAENWGILQGIAEKSGLPMSVIDGLIAATAYTHNLILVTRNVDDFQAGNVPLFNPWISR